MTSIRVHHTENKTFVVEGLERREEKIPAYALPGTIDSAYQGEQSMEVVIPALRFAPTVDVMLKLVRFRAGEGDMDPVIFGPGRRPAHTLSGDGPVAPCPRTAALAKLEGGYMVTTLRLLKATAPPSANDMKSKTGRDVAHLLGSVLPTMEGMFVGVPRFAEQKAHAVGTLDEALGVLEQFFSAP